MNQETFIQHFEEAIEGIEPGSVRMNTVMRDLAQWDSLAVLTTLAMVDAEYEVVISANELAECRTVEDLFQLVSGKKGQS